MSTVLFDIDGTVLDGGGAGRRALITSTTEFFELSAADAEREISAIDFRGATDSAIFAEMSKRLGLATQISASAFVPVYLRHLAENVSGARVLPGVLELLLHLQRLPNVTLGLLTGNIRAAARLKLEGVGLEFLDEGPGGFGDDGHERWQLAAKAGERMGALGLDPAQAIVIGDTQHDVFAAQKVGMRAVAVASGWTERVVLEDSGAELVLDDLSDPKPLLALLGV